MYRTLFGASCVATVMILALACSGGSPSPTSPMLAGGSGKSDAVGPGGSTLKVTAPTPAAPIDDVEIEGYQPELVAANALGQYVEAFDLAYRFQLFEAEDTVVFEVLVAGGDDQTTAALDDELDDDRTYRWRVRAELDTYFGPWSTMAQFRTAEKDPRTPDPAPGTRLPLPDMSHIVHQVAREYPAALQNSCQEHGGTWEFMDRVVDRLRLYDTRWGYNWKHGQPGNPSLDVVDYHYSAGPDEGSTDVYIIDIIGGHCGPSPIPTWFDQTDATRDARSIGRWTGRGRF